MRKLLALVLLLPALLVSPAAADEPGVQMGYAGGAIPVGAGWLLVLECEAKADFGPTAVIPIATYVRCTVNGFSETRVTPGDRSAVVVTSADRGPFHVCIEGYAAFSMNMGAIYLSPPRTYCFDIDTA